jgi:hypothetical protein
MSLKSVVDSARKGLYSFGKDAVGSFTRGYKFLHALPIVGGIIDESEAVGKGILGSYLSDKVGSFLHN